MFSELGEDGQEVLRLPCHSEATSCTMNLSTAEGAFRNSNNCPSCQQLYPSLPGPQPSGVMKSRMDPSRDCEGHAAGRGSIAVRYEFEGGVQLEQHPEPGGIYKGRTTNVFLPNDDAGSKALQLLKLAFERGLLFRVGKSVTTGKPEFGVVWNGIHQRTRRDGGATNHVVPRRNVPAEAPVRVRGGGRASAGPRGWGRSRCNGGCTWRRRGGQQRSSRRELRSFCHRAFGALKIVIYVENHPHRPIARMDDYQGTIYMWSSYIYIYHIFACRGDTKRTSRQPTKTEISPRSHEFRRGG